MQQAILDTVAPAEFTAYLDQKVKALRDYVRLGGDEAYARSRRITPASFVMAATCRMLAERETPFAYLGYMYPFEALTPVLTARAQVFLSRHGYPAEARRFIDVHAEEDVAHAALLKDCIEEIIGDYPEAAAAIDYSFECFTRVYPLPIWEAALDHARAELAMHGND